VKHGVPVTTLFEHPQIDLDIDGADQIDPQLNLIKGLGGALTKEKIVASSSKSIIIVADETKLVENLGEKSPLPIEVLPFALPLVSSKIRELGGKPVLREKKDNSGPYMTDNGNFIIDVNMGIIEDPQGLEQKLKAIPGIVETGLFINLAHAAYIGYEKTVKKIIRKL
jgi:ribose 5-phosphate isomerase A